MYIVGYLDERCRGKVFPLTETTGGSLVQKHGGHQGERVYSPEGLNCTLAANPGGFGGKTGLYEVSVPIKSDLARNTERTGKPGAPKRGRYAPGNTRTACKGGRDDRLCR